MHSNSVAQCLLLSVLFASNLLGQAKISNLNLRGLQIGSTTEMVVSGQGISKGSKLFLPFAAEQEIVEENGSSLLKVKVTLADQIQPGMYPLRIFNEDGLSDPVLIGVDRLVHREFGTEPQELPVALTGKVAGAQILKTTFKSKKGDLVVAEIESNRLGAKLRPVIELYDRRGRLIASGQPTQSLRGDTRCFFVAPEDGDYNLELHDFLYRGASPGFFRLKLGQFEYADVSLPVGVERGKKNLLRLIKLGAASEFLTEGQFGSYGWTRVGVNRPLFSGFAPQVYSSSHSEFVEVQDEKGKQLAGAVPLGINGRLSQPREVDRFTIDVKPGSKLTFDLMGRRLGSPIDAKLVIRNEAGAVLAQNDDRKGEQDALLNYNVPGNLKKLVAEISDVSAQGSKSHVYRLSVTEQTQPRISAFVDQGTIRVGKNSTVYVPVRLVRNQYAGAVDLVFHGLPGDYKVQGEKIPAGSDVGLVTISSHRGVPRYFSMTAHFMNGEQQVDVLGPENAFTTATDPRRKLFAIAPAASRSLSLDWADTETEIVGELGAELRSKVTIQRSEGMKGPVRIRLITNQKTPKKRIRKNNKDTFVDDLEKMIRAKPIELADGASSADVELLVPADVAEKEWQILWVAELLSADKKTVLFASATPAYKFITQKSFAVRVTEGHSMDLPRSGTANYIMKGVIDRKELKGPCRITLTGLPKGVAVTPVVVDARSERV